MVVSGACGCGVPCTTGILATGILLDICTAVSLSAVISKISHYMNSNVTVKYLTCSNNETSNRSISFCTHTGSSASCTL